MLRRYLYNIVPRTILNNTSVIVEENCNGWSAINLGTTLAVVNGFPINPGVPGTNNGESISFGGNLGEIFWGRIDISFPAGNVGNVLIQQKIYLPNTFKNESHN